MNIRISLLLLAQCLFISCGADKNYIWKNREVTVSAYNSVPNQTMGDPNLAAWGDTLHENMKAIAISRDLIRLGIGHNTQVKVEGLNGIYLVKDKMHKRYRNRIDVFMGKDIERARNWGQKKRNISYRVPIDSTISK